jgi:hypothetical protein
MASRFPPLEEEEEDRKLNEKRERRAGLMSDCGSANPIIRPVYIKEAGLIIIVKFESGSACIISGKHGALEAVSRRRGRRGRGIP